MIIRAKGTDITTIRTDFIENYTISFRAKGLMMIVLSEPERKFTIRQLMTLSGGHNVRMAVCELVAAGHCKEIEENNKTYYHFSDEKRF